MIVLGRGLLASGFAPWIRERDDVLVFAKGVARSTGVGPADFDR
jgi:hypothetical protein